MSSTGRKDEIMTPDSVMTKCSDYDEINDKTLKICSQHIYSFTE